jgi:hypothetical protein
MEKIFKFSDFILESNYNSPESYVSDLLSKLKKRIESFFGDNVMDKDVDSFDTSIDRDKKESGKMSFQDLGLTLDSIEISKYSKMYDNLKFKFSDDQFLYDVTIIIDLKNALPEKDSEEDFSTDDIKECFFKFKKYDTENFDLLGQLSKTVKIKDISEDLLISLKLELDEDSGSDENFEIETEE